MTLHAKQLRWSVVVSGAFFTTFLLPSIKHPGVLLFVNASLPAPIHDSLLPANILEVSCSPCEVSRCVHFVHGSIVFLAFYSLIKQQAYLELRV